MIIEDTLEIQCRAENLVQLHTSEAADLTRLVRATMRLRPDRIIIGEVRGARSAGTPEGVADRASRRRHHDPREFRQGGADAAFESGAGGGRAAAAGADRRDHRSDRFHRADAEGPRVTELVRVESYDAREGFSLREWRFSHGDCTGFRMASGSLSGQSASKEVGQGNGE